MPTDSVTLFRHATPGWQGGPTVHVLDKRQASCWSLRTLVRRYSRKVLAEQVTVERDALARRPEAELVNRGYCRHCIGTIAQATV